MRKIRLHAVRDYSRLGPVPVPKISTMNVLSQQANVLLNHEKIARLLRLFSSPRKRQGLTPDELLIFIAIGFLGIKLTGGAIQVTPVGMVEVSSLLGIPKETVRRKVTRLVDLDYVSSSPKGAFVKNVLVWCQMLEQVVV